MDSRSKTLILEKTLQHGDQNVDRPNYRSQVSIAAGGDSNAVPISPCATIETLVAHLRGGGKVKSKDDEDDELTLSEGGGGHDEEEKSKRHSSHRSPKKHKERRSQHDDEIGEKLKKELNKYKQELKEYNETTKDLEEKYMKINNELSEMQLKHDHFVSRQDSSSDSETEVESKATYCDSDTSMASALSVKWQGSPSFSCNSSYMTMHAKPSLCNDISQRDAKKYIENSTSSKRNDKQKIEKIAHRKGAQYKRGMRTEGERDSVDPSLQDVYYVLKDVINTSQGHDHKHKHERGPGEVHQLHSTIKTLKSEQLQYRTIIRQQQDRLVDYHARCVKAEEIMKTQKHEIEKLNVNNKQLEDSIYSDIDNLRIKIDAKLKNISHLPQKIRDEHIKYEKVVRENCILTDKLRILQDEASQLKIKIDELGRRKLVTINRLKATERDLKIFKNHNAALKTEKRRMLDELSAMKQQLEALQATSKRQMIRHRDQSEKQRRDLQKRIFDLELQLNRSQNSTSSLIQERDSLIAELQTQLHTLVHNFEVSQKHIRVLRHHIYSMTTSAGGSAGTSQRGSEVNYVRANQISLGHSGTFNRSSLKNRS